MSMLQMSSVPAFSRLAKGNSISATTSTTSDEPYSEELLDISFEPVIIDQYPQQERTVSALSSLNIKAFCLPKGLQLVKGGQGDLPMPIFYTFAFALPSDDSSGSNQLYGTCLRFYEQVPRKTLEDFIKSKKAQEIGVGNIDLGISPYYAPKCICCISYHPFILAFRTWLTELYRQSLTPSLIPIERHISNLFQEIPLPQPYFDIEYKMAKATIKFARAPRNNPLAVSSCSIRILFELLSLENILFIYRCLIVEKKVLVLSEQYSVLSEIMEAFQALMFPLKWQQIYYPVLPSDIIEVLFWPNPYFVGTHSTLIDSNQISTLAADLAVLIVDSTGDRVVCKHQPPELPTREHSKLMTQLTPTSQALYNSNQNKFMTRDHAFRNAPPPDEVEEYKEITFDEPGVRYCFCRCWISLFKDYKTHVKNKKDPFHSWDTSGFLAQRSTSDHPFLKEMFKTTAFEKFITRAIKDSQSDDIRFFDEKIIEKLNRSTWSYQTPTPFIDNPNYKIVKTWSAPPPYVDDLKSKTGLKHQAEDGTFEYKDGIPRLDPDLFGKPVEHTKKKTDRVTPLAFASLAAQDGTEQKVQTPGQFPSVAGLQRTNSIGIASKDPTYFDRVTYQLWFKLFLGQMTPNSPSMYLDVIKQMLQKMHLGGTTPSRKLCEEIVQAFGTCGPEWARNTTEILYKMNDFGIKPDQSFFATMLGVMAIAEGDLESAYRKMGRIKLVSASQPKKQSQPFQLLIKEKIQGFEKYFPKHKISISEKCTSCGFVLNELNIREGWRADENDYCTTCPECLKSVTAQFQLQEPNRQKPTWCQYISPVCLQKEALTIVKRKGYQYLCSVEFRSTRHHIFWNLIWHFVCLRIPINMFKDAFAPEEWRAPGIRDFVQDKKSHLPPGTLPNVSKPPKQDKAKQSYS